MTRTDDDSLRRLPEHDLAPAPAERLRRRAHAILNARAHARPRSWPAYYHRVVEPAALFVLGLGFVISSFQGTIALIQ
jgi:hypothetical protein